MKLSLEDFEVQITADGDNLETCFCESGNRPKFGFLKFKGQATCMGWIVHCPDCGLYYGIYNEPPVMAREWNKFTTWKKQLPQSLRKTADQERESQKTEGDES